MSKLTEEQLTGLNIVIKSVSKKYYFIVGWKLDKDNEKYEHATYIDLIVNLKKLSEYYNMPIHSKMGGVTSGLNCFFASYDPLTQKKEWEELWEFFHKEKNKLQEDFMNIYETIPDEYLIKKTDSKNPRRILIDDYIVDEKNPD